MGGFVRGLLAVGLLFWSLSVRSAHAMIAGPTLVQVSCACQDATGKAYLQAMHEILGRSPQFQEIGAGQANGAAIQVKIVSTPTISHGQPRTTLSIVCLHNGTPVLSQDIETCNQYPVVNFVQTIMSELGSL